MVEKEICLVCNNELPEDATECPTCGFPVVSVLHGTDEEKRRLKEMADEYRKEHWHPLEDEKKKQQDAEYLEMQKKLNEEQQLRRKLEEELRIIKEEQKRKEKEKQNQDELYSDAQKKLKEKLQKEQQDKEYIEAQNKLKEEQRKKEELEKQRKLEEERKKKQEEKERKEREKKEQLDFWKKELEQCFPQDNIRFAPDIPETILKSAATVIANNSVAEKNVLAVCGFRNGNSVNYKNGVVITQNNRIIFKANKTTYSELAKNITNVSCKKFKRLMVTSGGALQTLKIPYNINAQKLATMLKNAAKKYGNNVSSDIVTEEQYKKLKKDGWTNRILFFTATLILVAFFGSSGIITGAVITSYLWVFSIVLLFVYGA